MMFLKQCWVFDLADESLPWSRKETQNYVREKLQVLVNIDGRYELFQNL